MQLYSILALKSKLIKTKQQKSYQQERRLKQASPGEGSPSLLEICKLKSRQTRNASRPVHKKSCTTVSYRYRTLLAVCVVIEGRLIRLIIANPLSNHIWKKIHKQQLCHALVGAKLKKARTYLIICIIAVE